jgi:hypothetical protein
MRLRQLWAATLLAMTGLVAVGCSSTAGTPAGDILRRTVPPGESVPSLSGPAWSGQSAQFTWDFDTHMSATAYSEWLTQQLRGDFQPVERDGSHLFMTKHASGDLHRLRLAFSMSGPLTHVQAVLTSAPD